MEIIAVMGPLLAAVVPLAIVLVLLANIWRKPDLDIDVDTGRLVIALHGWDAVYCARRQIVVALDQVAGVAASPRELVPAKGLRLPGTSFPGVIRAGSYGTGARRDFWDVRRAQIVLVIQLNPGSAYRRLVLEVADPHAEALRLQPTLGTWSASFS